MKNVRLNKTKLDHIDDWATHAVNAAEYGINYLFPLMKAAAACTGLDPGEEILDDEGKIERVVESPIIRGASAMAVIGDRKIERRRLI